ncbi:MAG: methyltransferase domain-containing protein [Mucinivorans sp.]
MQHNKELIINRFTHSMSSYDTIATVQKNIADILAQKLTRWIKAPKNGVEIGSGTGFLTKNLIAQYPNCHWIANDITAESAKYLPQTIEFIQGDGESIEIPCNQDIIASSSTLQWFDDMPAFVEKTAANLAKKGILAISTFGPDNFKEILATTGQGLTYHSQEQLIHILQANNFKVLESKAWYETLQFASGAQVLRHLKLTGVNAIEPVVWTKSKLQNFEKIYIEKFDSPTLTFHPIIIIAQKL